MGAVPWGSHLQGPPARLTSSAVLSSPSHPSQQLFLVPVGGHRAVASDEGGREGTTCCWATVHQVPCLRNVSKATWGDVVTAVGRRFLARKVGPEWAVALLNSVSPHSQAPGPRIFIQWPRKRRQRLWPTHSPLSTEAPHCLLSGYCWAPVLPTGSHQTCSCHPAPTHPLLEPAFSLLFMKIHLLVFRPFSPSYGQNWKMRLG